MIASDARHRACRFAAGLLVLCLACAPARARDSLFVDARRGTILIHGNYCGPGNRSPLPPVDALDRACMHHDACSPPRGEIATCACNDRLHAEAEAVASDPRAAESLRDTAGFVAETALALPCR